MKLGEDQKLLQYGNSKREHVGDLVIDDSIISECILMK
jgi:hypothetical protein